MRNIKIMKLTKVSKNQSGIAHPLMLIGLAALLIVVIGFAGLRVYKSKNNINAKANNYSTRIAFNAKIYLCQVTATGRWVVQGHYINYSTEYMGNLGLLLFNQYGTQVGILLMGEAYPGKYSAIKYSTAYSTPVYYRTSSNYLARITSCY